MTVQQLSELYYIRKLIKREEVRLATLREIGNKERHVEEIARTENKILKAKAEYEQKATAIEEYIYSVEDYRMRLILSLRFIDLLEWSQIAMKIGGGNTDDSVKKACYRFLKSTNPPTQKK